MNPINEQSLAEQSLVDWIKDRGYEYIYGPDINPGQQNAERTDFHEVVLKDRLLGAIRRLNPHLPQEQAEFVATAIEGFTHADLILGNKEIYSWITDGKKHVWREEGEERAEIVKLIDFDNPEANDFLFVNQFTVKGIEAVCRFDGVTFVNGLPLSLFELKSPVRDSATIGEAYRDVEAYKKDIPKIFLFNQAVVLSDLINARHGTVSSSWERYGTWKGINSESDVPKGKSELEVLVSGLFDKRRFLDVVRNFVVFEADGDGDAVTYTKKMCLYHQYYGVNDTVNSTIRAVRGEQDRKIGVFWHTQGSGKSLSMVFYVNKTKRVPELKSPAYVFLTDREDLDDQLFKTFSRTGYGTLAKRASSISDLQSRLSHLGSELIFTTIQKFQDDPDANTSLTDRQNIIVVADEAHRTQYSVLAGNVRQALPNASFLGVTGTPNAMNDKHTATDVGRIVSSYKIGQSVKDGATVDIYYEGRLVPLHLTDQFVDSKFDQLLGEILVDEKAKVRQEWAVLEEIVGSRERIKQIAQDVIQHFTSRPLDGKAMIVTMSRRIAVEMYKQIQAVKGAPECAVVISNSDEFAADIQKEHNVKALEKRFKKTNDPLKIAIVCDMWLTGFDVPCLQTMYLDKPLKNHGLMQAIARVNRVFKDKQGGLIVDYIGIADNLKSALAIYDSDVQRSVLLPLGEVIKEMMSLYQRVSAYFEGIDYSAWKKLKGSDLSELFHACIEQVISKDGVLSDGKKMEYIGLVAKLSKLHALAMPTGDAMAVVNDLLLFQAVREGIQKKTIVPKTVFPYEKESAIRSLLHDAIDAEGVIDLFSSGGESKSISIFDEKFAEEIKKSKYKNLAVDSVRKLLDEEIITRMRTNKARYETMLTMLNELIEKYENNVISSAEIIKRLLEIADEIKQLDQEGRALGLSPEEITFYDTLVADPDLKGMDIDMKEFAKDLTKRIRRDLTIDWTSNETIKARIRQNVRLLLIQKGVIQPVKTERIIDYIFQQTIRIYRDYSPQTQKVSQKVLA